MNCTNCSNPATCLLREVPFCQNCRTDNAHGFPQEKATKKHRRKRRRKEAPVVELTVVQEDSEPEEQLGSDGSEILDEEDIERMQDEDAEEEVFTVEQKNANDDHWYDRNHDVANLMRASGLS